MSDTSQGPGWWVASDGKWYPPDSAPQVQARVPENASVVSPDPGATIQADTSELPAPLRGKRGWFAVPGQPGMAQYWNGRKWEGPPQSIVRTQGQPIQATSQPRTSAAS